MLLDIVGRRKTIAVLDVNPGLENVPVGVLSAGETTNMG